MRKKYVYKCVKVLNRTTFESVYPPSHRLSLRYRIRRWTKAYNGTPGIFVFRTLRDARGWSNSGIILKCEYVGEPMQLLRRMDFWGYTTKVWGYKALVSIFSTPEKREKMIYRINNLRLSRFNVHAPSDTHVVNAVKPVKISYPVRASELENRFRFREGKYSFKPDNKLPKWMTNDWDLKR